MLNEPAKAARLPATETPPEIPALPVLKLASEKHFRLKTGPISLAQVSAVTAATEARKRKIKKES